ncbi:MAG: hypothetical protein ACC645_07735, partial [Pirellulales bacterium]
TAKPSPVFPRDHHAWARFEAGAWKTCRVVTETLNAQGEVVNINLTTTTTSLERVGESDYTLRIEATVEVQGKKFPGQPQTITYGLFGQAEGETTHVKEAEGEVITLEGQPFSCRAWIVESTSEEKSRTTKLLVAEERSPYILPRETATTAADGKTPSSTTTEQVVAVDMPHKISGDILTASHIRTVRKTPKGTSITLAVHSDKVPGGVVYHTSKELDTDGRLIRRSTLELIDYDFQSDRRSLRQRRARHGRQSENADGNTHGQASDGLSTATDDYDGVTDANANASRVSLPR